MNQRIKDVATGMAVGYGVGAAVVAIATAEDELSRKDLRRSVTRIRKDPAQAVDDFGVFLLVLAIWPRLFLGYIREEL